MTSVFSDGLLPSLAGAIYTSDLPNRFEARQRVWDFAHVLMSHKKVYYGRLLQSRNVLISMKLLPFFLRLHPIPDYKMLYRADALSDMGKSIMDILVKAGPLMTIDIKKRLKISRKKEKKTMDNALKELQKQFLICCIGKIAHCECRWRFSLWISTSQWLSDSVKHSAQAHNRKYAMTKIIEKFLYATVHTTETNIAKFFKWPLPEVRAVVQPMMKKKLVSSYVYAGKTHIIL